MNRGRFTGADRLGAEATRSRSRYWSWLKKLGSAKPPGTPRDISLQVVAFFCVNAQQRIDVTPLVGYWSTVAFFASPDESDRGVKTQLSDGGSLGVAAGFRYDETAVSGTTVAPTFSTISTQLEQYHADFTREFPSEKRSERPPVPERERGNHATLLGDEKREPLLVWYRWWCEVLPREMVRHSSSGPAAAHGLSFGGQKPIAAPTFREQSPGPAFLRSYRCTGTRRWQTGWGSRLFGQAEVERSARDHRDVEVGTVCAHEFFGPAGCRAGFAFFQTSAVHPGFGSHGNFEIESEAAVVDPAIEIVGDGVSGFCRGPFQRLHFRGVVHNLERVEWTHRHVPDVVALGDVREMLS